VTGSELVGLIPLDAMLAAGRHYLRKQGASDGVPEADLIESAHQSMSLSQISKFTPQERIVEYRVRNARPLVERTVAGFVDELSRDSAAPGGGSVAALAGALGAGLAAMVANLTVGKPEYEAVEPEMIAIAERGQILKDQLIRAVDDDTFAFNEVMAAFALPKGAAREKAIDDANKKATLVPLSVLEAIPAVVDLAEAVGARGNRNSLSDSGVAVLAARTAATGAYYNVLINTGGLGDAAFVADVRGKADAAFAKVAARCDTLDSWFRERLLGKKD
jgi:glutamate formiminotransferase/formiminotetrahydrofolate cyclodeaminase